MGHVATLTLREFFSDIRAPIAVSRMPRQGSAGQHRHEFFEIAVVLSGTAIHVIGTFRHRIGIGDVLLLDRRCTHGYEETRSLNLLNLLVRADALVRIGRELADRPGYHDLFSLDRERDAREKRGFHRHLHLSPRELELIEEWAARIEEPVRRRTPRPSRRLEEAYLTLIIDVLSRKFERSAPAAAGCRSALPGSPSRVRMGRVLSWIETNLAQPLRLPDLAVRAGMSERTFLRAFRDATGLSPRSYIIRARLVWAAQRLDDIFEERSITEIAQDCGFDDSNYFSRAFRRFAKTCPTAYRAARRKG